MEGDEGEGGSVGRRGGKGDPEVQVAVRRQSLVDTVRRSLIMEANFLMCRRADGVCVGLSVLAVWCTVYLQGWTLR